MYLLYMSKKIQAENADIKPVLQILTKFLKIFSIILVISIVFYLFS